MKQTNFFGLLSIAATFFLLSCGNNESKTTTDANTDTTTVKTSDVSATTTVTNTTTTTPQPMMIVQQKIGNFEKWLAAYEANDSMRLANGIHRYVIGRGVKDPNTIFIAMKVEDINKAKEFSKSAGLKQAMKNSGAVSAPSFSFVVTTFQDTGTVNSPLRSRTTFTVKDWANWQSAFEKNRTDMAERGLALRAYGHEADNDKKVSVVTAVLDSTKAAEFWKSDLLKQRRAESGVVGEPTRFLFNVVKRY